MVSTLAHTSFPCFLFHYPQVESTEFHYHVVISYYVYLEMVTIVACSIIVFCSLCAEWDWGSVGPNLSKHEYSLFRR